MELNQPLRYEGCNFFRQRLILSCFCGKKTIIKNIRVNDENPGITDYESRFLNFLSIVTNGSVIKISDTGTSVIFMPGSLAGTEHPTVFECPNSRGVGYFLEPLIMIAPFCKNKTDITFKGVTNNDLDLSYDMIRYSLYPILEKFLVNDEGLSLKLLDRGLPPSFVKGAVRFRCPVRKSLKAFQWEEMGKVKKIRGTVFTKNIAPTVGNRVMDATRSVLKEHLTDVYFTCESSSSKNASPGYGACLVAETNKGCVISSEVLLSEENKSTHNVDVTPEDVGKLAAYSLFEEIYKAGVVDSISQPLILLFMALGPSDVSKVVLGPLSNYTMQFLRHLNDYLGVKFKIDEYKDIFEEGLKIGSPKILLSCVGIGFTNVNKAQI